ncbi:MAG: hypothetical protein V1909_04505 [Candidatus Micrarchaeota archaeon]
MTQPTFKMEMVIGKAEPQSLEPGLQHGVTSEFGISMELATGDATYPWVCRF